MKKIALILLAVALAGCSTLTNWTPLAVGEYRDSARKFTAQVPQEWMRFNRAAYFIMTRDGIALNAISVETRRFKDTLESTKKQFLEDMSLQDLAEVEIDNYRSSPNVRNFQIVKNQPATLSGVPGFVLEYTLETPQGMPFAGIHYGFKADGKIYRVQYEAPQQHYFKKHLPVFEEFVRSFKLI